jgi:hypothetical protein
MLDVVDRYGGENRTQPDGYFRSSGDSRCWIEPVTEEVLAANERYDLTCTLSAKLHKVKVDELDTKAIKRILAALDGGDGAVKKEERGE